MLNLQAFPFVLYKNLIEAIFLFLFLFCPPFVPFLSPVFLYLCMWDKKQ